MTCIVAINDKKNKTMYMGADSLMSSAEFRCETARKKIFEVGPYLIGGCGYSRLPQIVEFGSGFPDPDSSSDLLNMMCTVWVEHLKELLSSAGYLKKANEVTSFNKHSMLIVAVKGRIFEVWDDFGIDETNLSYNAVGSGYGVAIGSLFNDAESGFLLKDPKESIRVAIKASGTFVPSVGGKTNIIQKTY